MHALDLPGSLLSALTEIVVAEWASIVNECRRRSAAVINHQ
jgi:hypothetical protein